MTQTQVQAQVQEQIPTRVAFTQNVGFRKELNQRVDAYFKREKLTTRDNPAMYFKTLIIIGWVVAAWVFVLFGPPALWMKAIGCVLLGAGIAGIGFSVGHDANHGAYSSKKWVNSIVGLTYDVIGVSSYLWRYRHNYLHHTYTNVLGHDVEIHGDGLVRMTPHMEHQWYHKFQHLFISLVYAIIPFYWAIADVNLILFKRRYHSHVISNVKPIEVITLLVGKLIWLALFVAIPIALGYNPLLVLLGFSIAYMTYGLLICNVFMLAHVLEEVEFIQPDDANQIEDEWAIFQIKTTADFAPKNWFLNWYLGGLNYQVIHHLFPQICHIHYPKLAPIVADLCSEFEIKYYVYPTFRSALVSNYRFLKFLGTVPNQAV